MLQRCDNLWASCGSTLCTSELQQHLHHRALYPQEESIKTKANIPCIPGSVPSMRWKETPCSCVLYLEARCRNLDRLQLLHMHSMYSKQLPDARRQDIVHTRAQVFHGSTAHCGGAANTAERGRTSVQSFLHTREALQARCRQPLLQPSGRVPRIVCIAAASAAAADGAHGSHVFAVVVVNCEGAAAEARARSLEHLKEHVCWHVRSQDVGGPPGIHAEALEDQTCVEPHATERDEPALPVVR